MALHAQREFAPIGAAQKFEDFAWAFLDIGDWLPVNLHDAITRQDAGDIAGTSGNNTFDMDCVVEVDEDYADVRNYSVSFIFCDFGILGLKVTGVGVKAS